jgi:hypothetical protein
MKLPMTLPRSAVDGRVLPAAFPTVAKDGASAVLIHRPGIARPGNGAVAVS